MGQRTIKMRLAAIDDQDGNQAGIEKEAILQ